MIVYRLEHGTHSDNQRLIGKGPYQYYSLREIPCAAEFLDDQDLLVSQTSGAVDGFYYHPGPYRDDWLNGISDWESCGTISMDALNRWFTPERIRLWTQRFGFVVARYYVPDAHCRVGRCGQVLFSTALAEKVEEEFE